MNANQISTLNNKELNTSVQSSVDMSFKNYS